MSAASRKPVPRLERARADASARGQRLDAWLAGRFPGWSRSRLQSWIRAGRVRVDGEAVPPGRRLRGSEEIEVRPPAPRPSRLEPVPMPLRILHRDAQLMVLEKPAGLVVHPGAGTRGPTLVHGLLALGVRLSGAGGEERPGIVHRLDRDTSGLMVVACTDAAHRALGAAFAGRRVRKGYDALCWGRPDPPEGLIDRAIGRDPVRRTTMSVRGRRRREARTGYRIREAFRGFSLLEIDLLTGRTHQIRAHLRSLGHPVVGDRAYGGAGWRDLREPELRERLRGFGRLALHAGRLGFEHPVSGEPLEFRAGLPAPFAELVEALRRRERRG